MKRIKFLFTLLFVSLTLCMMAGGRRVLFIGDSITDGAWGRSSGGSTPSEKRNHGDMNHIYGHGYMMIAASEIQALAADRDWKFWNRGISGNTLYDMSVRWKNDALALKPDVVSVLIGTNDVDSVVNVNGSLDVAAWGMRYRSLLDSLRRQNKEVALMLCTPFVAKSGKLAGSSSYEERERMIAVLDREVEKIAGEYHAIVVPFHSLVKNTIATHASVPASYWIWDGIHPTPAMHYLMARKWIECFYQNF